MDAGHAQGLQPLLEGHMHQGGAGKLSVPSGRGGGGGQGGIVFDRGGGQKGLAGDAHARQASRRVPLLAEGLPQGAPNEEKHLAEQLRGLEDVRQLLGAGDEADAGAGLE